MKKFSCRSKSSSTKKKIKFDFKPNSIIYEKEFDFEGKPFKIQMDVKPQKINEPTIEMKERN